MSGPGAVDDLETWLHDGYEPVLSHRLLDPGQPIGRRGGRPGGIPPGLAIPGVADTGGDIRPWLYRVVVNTCNSKLRKEIPHRNRRVADEELDGLPAPDDVADQLVGAGDLMTALQSLPAQLRIVIVLRYFADLSERELATAIGKRPGTVKSRLHEARRLLAEHPALRSQGPAIISEMNQ